LDLAEHLVDKVYGKVESLLAHVEFVVELDEPVEQDAHHRELDFVLEGVDKIKI